MTASNLIEGLELIQKSKPENVSDYHIRAEHDQIWAGSLDWPMPEEDKKRMKELGWHPEEDVDGWMAGF